MSSPYLTSASSDSNSVGGENSGVWSRVREFFSYPVGKDMGKFDEAFSTSTDISEIDLWDGFKADIQVPVFKDPQSPKQMMYMHRMLLGSSMIQEGSSYDMSIMYHHDRSNIQALIDGQSNFQGSVGYAWNSSAISRLRVLDVIPQPSMNEIAVSHEQRIGDAWYTFDIGRSVMYMSFMQAALPNFAIGASLMRKDRNLLQITAKYDDTHHFGGINFTTSTLGKLHGKEGLWKFVYGRRVTPTFTVSSELLFNPDRQESIVRSGFKLAPSENAMVRANFDGDGKVSSVMEIGIFPSLKFSASAYVDHPNNMMKFGYGVTLGL